jgi:hypothetical protein
MQAAHGYWRPLLSCSTDKGQTAHGSDLHLFRGHVWRGSVGHDEGGQRQDVSVKKALRSILALHPRDCSSDVLYGDTGLLHPVYSLMLPNWQHRCQNMEAGRWPKEALRFSFEGSRGVGRPKVGTDWCGNVNY